MSREDAIERVLDWTPEVVGPTGKKVAYVLMGVGVVGLVIGITGGGAWPAILVPTSLVIGLAVSGIVFSAIFQLTGARWGRAYSRLVEAGVVLMAVGLVGVLVLLIGSGFYLPWVDAHHLAGGKHVWLVHGFWVVRVLLALTVAYGLSLWFFYYSLRRDFCLAPVSSRLRGPVARFVSQGIADPEAERQHCSARLSVLAPVVLIAYAITFTLLGFDLIMALEPDWFSTLFGAWYFIGHLFAGLALMAVVSVALRRSWRLDEVLTSNHQRDLATILFAFCLVNIDFFWSQYLTIWYTNMPEETGYLIRRIQDESTLWPLLSRASLVGFFLIPFVALLFRRVKQSNTLLVLVALVVIGGIFLARFIEIAPPLLGAEAAAVPSAVASALVAAVLVFVGMLGAGLLLYLRLLTQVPIMPVGDELFLRQIQAGGGEHP